MLKISYAGCLGMVYPAISSQFILKMRAVAKKLEKKFTQNLFWKVQGRLRSSVLIKLISP